MELRRHARVSADAAPVSFVIKGSTTRESGVAKDISLGGMFVITDFLPEFNAELTVYVKLPGQQSELVLPGIVRWESKDGMGVQFGNLGARETHAITEFVATKTK